MSYHRFESSLSFDEIEKNFTDVDFFSVVTDGLQDAIAHSCGSPQDGTFERERSDTPKPNHRQKNNRMKKVYV